MTPDPLKLAIRVYPEPPSDDREREKLRHWRRPHRMFVFDTECKTDTAQALTFGSYRYFENNVCLEEGLFFGDDLPRADRAKLEAYVKMHAAGTDRRRGVPRLLLLSRREFLEKLYMAGFDMRAPYRRFQPTFRPRHASHATLATRADSVSPAVSPLALWDWVDKTGKRRINKHRPRIAIKHIDSKRALKGFTGTLDADPVDLIPEGSTTGEPEDKYKFRGHFLDLRTLAFVLTDRGHSLASACKAFGVEQGKLTVEQHGVITPEYIDYNRRDVEATAALAVKLLEEYDRFDVELQETQAYSPASLGKAHLRKMGIAPVLERQTVRQAVSRLRAVRVLRWPNERPYSESPRSGGLHRLSLDVSDRQRADGSLAVSWSPKKSPSSPMERLRDGRFSPHDYARKRSSTRRPGRDFRRSRA